MKEWLSGPLLAQRSEGSKLLSLLWKPVLPSCGGEEVASVVLGYTGLPSDLAAKENSGRESGGPVEGAHTWPPALPSTKFSRWLPLLTLLTLRQGAQREAGAGRTFFRPTLSQVTPTPCFVFSLLHPVHCHPPFPPHPHPSLGEINSPLWYPSQEPFSHFVCM